MNRPLTDDLISVLRPIMDGDARTLVVMYVTNDVRVKSYIRGSTMEAIGLAETLLESLEESNAGRMIEGAETEDEQEDG